MAPLSSRIAALRVDPEKLVSFWRDGDHFKGRADPSGRLLGDPADIVTTAALAHVAIQYLPSGNAERQRAIEICTRQLATTTATPGTRLPWNLHRETDPLGAVLTTGRVLLDLDTSEALLADAMLQSALDELAAWVQSAVLDAKPLALPLLYRAAAALKRHRPGSDMTAVGKVAQGFVHRFVSYHTLARHSQFDPSLLCVALQADNVFAPDPLSAHERSKCLDIAFGHSEPLISACRTTIMRLGNSFAGCSALDTLSWMFANDHLGAAAAAHEDQLEATLTWLEDHSQRVGSITLFQSDLYPDYTTFDAWYNCLVLTFLNALDRRLTRQMQTELRKHFSAVSNPDGRPLANAICGGFTWPNWLLSSFLGRVKDEGRIPDQMGNGIVLFGPPGTGKTSLAKSIARELTDWHFIELSTADFLENGNERLVSSIKAIFKKLRELERCVVFFDELELLVLDREREGSLAQWSIITNVMLPELQKLHDSPSIIPIFATNYVSRLDAAGRRPGRFDFILPVGLPSAAERRVLLDRKLRTDYMFPGIESIAQDVSIRELMEWAARYQATGRTGELSAQEVWDSGFKNLRADPDVLTAFNEDIRRLAYPPEARATP